MEETNLMSITEICAQLGVKFTFVLSLADLPDQIKEVFSNNFYKLLSEIQKRNNQYWDKK